MAMPHVFASPLCLILPPLPLRPIRRLPPLLPLLSPLRLLQEHLVLDLFFLSYLSKLAFNTKPKTTNPGRCLIVISSTATTLHPGLIANSSDVKIFIDSIKVIHSDLFNGGRFMIHDIDSFVIPLPSFLRSHGPPPCLRPGACHRRCLRSPRVSNYTIDFA